ncbi:MAG: thioredoxin [Salinivirgaceae bacterium]|nr:thioredoxin [Salinivirgaceae bacterium]
MSTTLLIVGGISLLFIGFIVFNYKKMKNMPNAASHEKIKILSSKNFKLQTAKGLVLVDFWAPWCGPCKMMTPVLNEMAEQDSHTVTIAKVNVDNQQQLAQKFKIRSIPTMMLFKDGKEIKRFAGVKTRKFLLKEMSEFINN